MNAESRMSSRVVERDLELHVIRRAPRLIVHDPQFVRAQLEDHRVDGVSELAMGVSQDRQYGELAAVGPAEMRRDVVGWRESRTVDLELPVTRDPFRGDPDFRVDLWGTPAGDREHRDRQREMDPPESHP